MILFQRDICFLEVVHKDEGHHISSFLSLPPPLQILNGVFCQLINMCEAFWITMMYSSSYSVWFIMRLFHVFFLEFFSLTLVPEAELFVSFP